jgi:endonuclease/exonuclease/phosphatase family metal-dependent hydrolase
MSFRIATLNLEQDHKRWELRRELIIDELGRLRPDLWALNEISIPVQTGRWLQRAARERLGIKYALLQQPKSAGNSQVEAEGILARFPPIEVTSLDYQADNAVAQVARFEIENRLVDLYVTHLYKSRGTDSLRQFQVERLLEWIQHRNDVEAQIICGDFNGTLEMPSIKLMTREFQPTQTQPTAFTPLADKDGIPTHPYWERMDRCIDYIWLTKCLTVRASGRCFDNASTDDPTLWPSDHVGVWADLDFDDYEVTNRSAEAVR